MLKIERRFYHGVSPENGPVVDVVKLGPFVIMKRKVASSKRALERKGLRRG